MGPEIWFMVFIYIMTALEIGDGSTRIYYVLCELWIVSLTFLLPEHFGGGGGGGGGGGHKRF